MLYYKIYFIQNIYNMQNNIILHALLLGGPGNRKLYLHLFQLKINIFNICPYNLVFLLFSY